MAFHRSRLEHLHDGRLRQQPIVVFPNSGQLWDAVARAGTGQSSISCGYGALAVEWRRQGATWLGGCCGTTPADIAQLRAALAA